MVSCATTLIEQLCTQIYCFHKCKRFCELDSWVSLHLILLGKVDFPYAIKSIHTTKFMSHDPLRKGAILYTF